MTENNAPGMGSDFGVDDLKQDDGVQEVQVEGYGTARVTLITFADVERFQNNGQDDVTINADQLARLFRANYVAPDMSGLTGEDVREMKPTAPGRLLDAIIDPDENVDVNVDASGTAQISTESGQGN